MSDFSFEHINLTQEQVKAAVNAFAPAASAANPRFANKAITIALDGGESLCCDFNKDNSTLTVRGLGASADNVQYAVLDQGFQLQDNRQV